MVLDAMSLLADLQGFPLLKTLWGLAQETDDDSASSNTSDRIVGGVGGRLLDVFTKKDPKGVELDVFGSPHLLSIT